MVGISDVKVVVVLSRKMLIVGKKENCKSHLLSLGYGRYFSKIIRPGDILSNLF